MGYSVLTSSSFLSCLLFILIFRVSVFVLIPRIERGLVFGLLVTHYA